MIIKDGYVLRRIADESFVIPIGVAAINTPKLLLLNESSVVLWERLMKGAEYSDLVEILTSEYEVSKDEAECDIREFIETLNSLDILEE